MAGIRFREGVDLITMISLNATMESRDRVYGKFFILKQKPKTKIVNTKAKREQKRIKN